MSKQKQGKGRGKGPKKTSKGPGTPGRGSGGPRAPPKDVFVDDDPVTLDKRTHNVRAWWKTLTPEERARRLAVSVADLREAADRNRYPEEEVIVAEGSELVDIADRDLLETALKRFVTKGTWKLWLWPRGTPQPPDVEFTESDAFRTWYRKNVVGPTHAKYLPDLDVKLETDDEEAFRKRISALYARAAAIRSGTEEPAAAAAGDADGKPAGEGKPLGRGGGEGREREGGVPRGRGGGRAAPRVRATSEQVQAARDIMAVGAIDRALREDEHVLLHRAVFRPVVRDFVERLSQQGIPTQSFEDADNSAPVRFVPEDLSLLPPEEVSQIANWIIERIDALGMRLRSETKDEAKEQDPDETMGDVDLFCLEIPGRPKRAVPPPAPGAGPEAATTSAAAEAAAAVEALQGATEEEIAGGEVRVNDSWLSHLARRTLGDDGQPRLVRDGEDAADVGLVVEWVYGAIVSTAEKGREAARSLLLMSAMTAREAHEQLMSVLQELHRQDSILNHGKLLLSTMVDSRRSNRTMMAQHPQLLALQQELAQCVLPDKTRDEAALERIAERVRAEGLEGNWPAPDETIIQMLHREGLLTDARVYHKKERHIQKTREQRVVEFEFVLATTELKRRLQQCENAKQAPRALDAAGHRGATRSQLADAAIEEQVAAQNAYREQQLKVQALEEHRMRVKTKLAELGREIERLEGWGRNLLVLVDELTRDIERRRLLAGANGAADVEEGGGANVAQRIAMYEHRCKFFTRILRELYTDEDDRNHFNWIQDSMRVIEHDSRALSVIAAHLESQVLNLACDDLGQMVSSQITLPVLRARLHEAAMEYLDQQAKAVEAGFLEEAEARERAAREERERAKARREEAMRLAEREAEERAERQRQAEAAAEAEAEARRQEEAARRAAEAAAARERELELERAAAEKAAAAMRRERARESERVSGAPAMLPPRGIPPPHIPPPHAATHGPPHPGHGPPHLMHIVAAPHPHMRAGVPPPVVHSAAGMSAGPGMPYPAIPASGGFGAGMGPPPPMMLTGRVPASLTRGPAPLRPRGLVNKGGEYNCFLNAAVQALCHIPVFRHVMLGSNLEAVERRKPRAEDLKVLRALVSVVRDMAAPPAASNGAAPAAQAPPTDPVALRSALSELGAGHAAFQLSEMHDASEVLDGILNCLHRADAGVLKHDPTLPHKAPPTAIPARHPLLHGALQPSYQQLPGWAAPQRRSFVQQLFGIEVQVPPDTAGPTAAAGLQRRPPRDVLHFVRFFHMVHVRTLHKARLAMPDAPLATLLREVECNPLLESAPFAKGGRIAVRAGAGRPKTTLVEVPLVFSVTLVWEHTKPLAWLVESVVSAVASSVEGMALGEVFANVEGNGMHALRSVLCFCDHHYTAFVRADTEGGWTLVDDENVVSLGTWDAAAAEMVKRNLAPLVLFYAAA
ncbi:unnamed protein product [Pedinophyceae sp. YPF-701]|nr:unnamed protein product [Pedinophyceae sp. YPF-701]